MYELRYYFNKAKGICEGLIYHGKGGNENLFDRFKDCKDMCYKTGSHVVLLYPLPMKGLEWVVEISTSANPGSILAHCLVCAFLMDSCFKAKQTRTSGKYFLKLHFQFPQQAVEKLDFKLCVNPGLS